MEMLMEGIDQHLAVDTFSTYDPTELSSHS